MLPPPPKLLGGLAPHCPPPPSSYAYDFFLFSFQLWWILMSVGATLPHICQPWGKNHTAGWPRCLVEDVAAPKIKMVGSLLTPTVKYSTIFLTTWDLTNLTGFHLETLPYWCMGRHVTSVYNLWSAFWSHILQCNLKKVWRKFIQPIHGTAKLSTIFLNNWTKWCKEVRSEHLQA